MTLEKRITRLEESINIKHPREPFLITVRVKGTPPIAQEQIDAAMDKARREGRDICIVEGRQEK